MVASLRLKLGLIFLLPFVSASPHNGPSSAASSSSSSSSSRASSSSASSLSASVTPSPSISVPSLSASSSASSSVNATTPTAASVSVSVPPTTSIATTGTTAATTAPISGASGPATIVAPIVPPISSYTFSPFPTPTQGPVSGVFPAIDPSNPPPVNSPLIPDFAPAWAAAYAKAQAKISNFTLDEKVSIATGVGWMNGRCVGNIPGIEPTDGRGWPGLCLEDSPLGVRDADYVTAFPAGITVASTWNRALMRARGVAMGQEHRGKGVNVALGPMMNMGRNPEGGRNWEGFGADPFLTGEAAYETILGMQSAGVQACAKHLINNEQEYDRTQESSDVDDRTEHEIYAHPFMKSVMAGVASMMCSYNLINGTYACENDKIMNDIIKREFGFQGYIMSDWQATHSTIGAITGLDMTMPGDIFFGSGTTYFGGNLTDYVLNGTIPESRVDDMATRILGAWYYTHQDSSDYPTTNFNAFYPDDEATNERIDVQDDHYKIVREVGAAGTVLLKNINNALPLNKPRSIALFGSDAGPAQIGANEFSDQGGQDGILAMGWGSGTANFTYLVSPLEAIQARARQDRTTVNWVLQDFNLDRAGNVAIRMDAALVFINSDSGEGYITVDGNAGDRKNLTAWHGGDDLVLAVAAQNKNTIVIVHSVGPLIVEPWIEHPNVTALLWANLPGTEAGNAITDVLYGAYNPSGRLPYTIAMQASDYPAEPIDGGAPNAIIDVPYTEGLEIDYRYFDAHNITPRFEFGFGLSYTTFAYSDLHISALADSDNTQADQISNWEAGNATPIAEGSTTALWPAYTVTFQVQNTGDLSGVEIPQLYLNMPASAGEPPSILKGFTNVTLSAGQSKTVTINLSRYDLSIWDVVAQGWRRPNGTIGFFVGASSRDVRLTGKIPTTSWN
ncbi:hypothetical protein H0H92_008842 [Tricholoma furcatifolium]|nr:hypothetical protein H0H92_008842 [Tricholoma furcatifolium]